jgi:hypothetical protein
MPKKKMKLSKGESMWVSDKIAHLIKNEGKTQKQAAGQAYGMVEERRKGKKHA